MSTIIGRVTKNAEISILKNDKQVVNFSVAINDSYKNKQGERVEKTTYYNCAYWQSPNVAKSLTKGTLVELLGRTSSNAWIGRDGEIKSGLNFHTSNIKFHGGGKREDVQTVVTEKAQDKKTFAEDTGDDLPF
ncbi:single-stranded DNA-binding protein [Elizabethkingia meningoseptica]|uniref:single-stranded DNA-binding protein n=1 Tax=Elizabethkingia meningoseptica TaxID=238 RepID=UPI0022F1A60B|nr:single-stranded DNA-binding protein [Elizabethkingia meningoseptica]EJK5328076.1 single-stranded DNA-binding protein [Elizabethkingia meningoseptica]WBS74161.1 single-stranded DNA-binding protein [Elizabethkingia meningoseptica]